MANTNRRECASCLPYGIINAHAGDLPRYRGNAVPNWAVIQGERKIVSSLHLMTKELDAGPIVLQREMEIDDQTYIGEIYAFLERVCPEMFLEALNRFEEGSVELKAQPADPALSLRFIHACLVMARSIGSNRQKISPGE